MIKSLRFIMIIIVSFLGVIYLLLVTYLYFNQEGMIFQPEVLTKNYKFSFDSKFEELSIPVEKGVNLNGLLFKADETKGLVFYLHGNGGSVKGWGEIASTYNDMGYDIFILDYRGYGKSGGKISGEQQFLNDVQKAYDYVKADYPENKIIIVGYSIGTGPAAKLASDNKPAGLVLQAPYYSLRVTISSMVPFMPGFLKKYNFETHEFLQKVKVPVCIFHGTADNLLPYTNAEKLKAEFKERDTLITLPGQGHNGINDNQLFKIEFKKFADLNSLK